LLKIKEGKSIGSLFAIYNIAKRIGLEKALGKKFQGKLALYQIISRIIEQGSRLSSTPLSKIYDFASVLELERGFDENDLYENLHFLSDNQKRIEDELFFNKKQPSTLFLYDVTSTYLEGENNAFSAYGYNRDGKKGKKQIVIGLLCDETGFPLSTEVFKGNTNDLRTFSSQVMKAKERFGCTEITFVGDKGMIKKAQIEKLQEVGFHYITTISKKEITTLLKKNILQMEIFDTDVMEIKEKDVKYILRKNPTRAEEIANTRKEKQNKIISLLEEKNNYLKKHPRASVEVAFATIEAKIKQLKTKWIYIEKEERELLLKIDEEILQEESKLDGCYVVITDSKESNAKIIHDRYKDLIEVEMAFRTFKTTHLEIRPVYVRSEKSTRGHVFAIMLSYMIVKHLQKAWKEFDFTVEEGIKSLSTLCLLEAKLKNGDSFNYIPSPRAESQKLLKALEIKLPEILHKREVNVVSRKKINNRR